ncbi:aminoglycoside phosphotransferase family protein, partial [Actinoplanes sp. NPDC051633]|uniref:aminoglycoside phosphotransferase family protein n=1 Tax=Actinoplanes sp. NPDC051633 TaxID=3155670 RepID=UPI00342211C1
KLSIPTPGVHRTGEFEGWGYVLMDRLPGRALIETWDEVDRDRLADRLGEAIVALHAIPPPAIDDWWPEDWAEFAEEQRDGCVMRHQALGLDDEWVARIEPFLDSVDLGDDSPVLLHTEIMRVHLLTGASGEPTGLIDFEPAMRGAPEYEYAAVGAYVSQGDPGFLRRVLIAAGYRPDELTADLRRRLMAWLLLHYYSNVAKYFEHLPAPAEPTFESLADTWFATD